MQSPLSAGSGQQPLARAQSAQDRPKPKSVDGWQSDWGPSTRPAGATPNVQPPLIQPLQTSLQNPRPTPSVHDAQPTRRAPPPEAGNSPRSQGVGTSAKARQGSHQMAPDMQQLLTCLSTWGNREPSVMAAWLRDASKYPGFLRRLRVVPQRPDLPTMRGIVIVEGLADCAAVHRAVNAVVYVCDGSSVKSGGATDDLWLIHGWPGGCIILTDPDAPGRELRMFLDEHLVQRAQVQARVLHAFVSVEDATATTATKWHDEGSTGVENAAPSQVWASIKGARLSYPDTRKEFTVKELQDRGLSNTFDAKQVLGAKLRRKQLCDRLGIDNCTGKSLANVLNRFFERDEFEAALAGVPPRSVPK